MARSPFNRESAIVGSICIFLLAVGSLSAGCRPPERARVGATAMLEVINPTDKAHEIFMAGQRIGRVAPKARVRFRSLPGRVVTLSATPIGGDASVTTQASLHPGEIEFWIIADAEQVESLPPGFGSIAVANDLGRDVELRLDERRVGSLFAGESRMVDDIPAGSYLASAVVTTTRERLLRTLDVLEGTVTSWRLDAPMGIVALHNSWDEAVSVTLAGLDVGRVAAGDSVDYPKQFAGRTMIEVTGEMSRSVVREVLTVLPDEVTVFTLADGDGSVRVTNLTEESLAVAIDGRVREILPAQESQTFSGMPPGVLRVEVVGSETGMRLSRTLRLTGGEQAHWQVDPRYGTMRIYNASPERQLIYVDGHRSETVAPGERVHLRRVAVGEHIVSVVGEQSLVRRDHSLSVTPAASPQLIIRGSTGGVVLHNQRDEPLRLYLDSAPVGEVAAGHSLQVESIPTGRRLMEAVGLDSGHVVREQIEIDEDQMARLNVRDDRGLLAIRNRSGEALATGPLLSRQAPVIYPDEEAVFNLSAGSRGITLRGQGTGFLYRMDVTLKPDERTEWTIGPPTASFLVFNRSGEEIEVSLAGASLGRLPPGDDMLIPDLPAGRHLFTVEGLRSGALLERRVAPQPEARGSWEIRPQLARMRVQNQTAEALEIFKDGRPYGRVEAGGVIGLGNLAPGEHRFEARGLRTGARFESTQEVTARQSGLWRIQPAEGTVLVSSAHGTAERVSLNGREVGLLGGPEERVTAAAPAGMRAIQIDPRDTGPSHREVLKVSPERTTQVHVSPTALVVQVVNETQFAVNVRWEGRVLAEIGPGATTEIPGLPTRKPVVLRATTEEGRGSFQRTFRLMVPEHEPTDVPATRWILTPAQSGDTPSTERAQ